MRFERFGRALYPLIVLFQNVPKVALAPIFILWFGFDLAPKIVLIVVIAFFPVAIDMLAGLQSVEPSFVALMRSVGASRGKILMRVRIPHSLPHLMAGLKVAITFSVIGAIVGEFAGANQGLGYVIEFASTQLDTPLIFAALIVVSRAGPCFLLRRRACGADRWFPGHRNSIRIIAPVSRCQKRRSCIMKVYLACRRIATTLLSTSAYWPQDNVSVQLDYVVRGDHAMFFVAKEKGYFAKQGIDVTAIRRGTGSPNAMRLVGNGNAEFGFGDLPTLAVARSQDVPVVALVAVNQHSPLAHAGACQASTSSQSRRISKA